MPNMFLPGCSPTVVIPLLVHGISTGVIQLIPPVLSSETLLHILLSEYSGFRPSTTAVVTQPVHT